jgi:hypothetical protein
MKNFLAFFAVLIFSAFSISSQKLNETQVDPCGIFYPPEGSSTISTDSLSAPPALPKHIVHYLKKHLPEADFSKLAPALINKLEAPAPESDEEEEYIPKKRMLIVTVNIASSDGLFEKMSNLNAKELARRFKEIGFTGIDNGEFPTILEGVNAAQTEFETLVERQPASPEDMLVIYIIAHGEYTGSNFSLWFWKNKVSIPTLVEAIRTREDGLPPWGNVYLILDSCYSGKALDIILPLPEQRRQLAIMTSAVEPVKPQKDDPNPPSKITGEAVFLGGDIKATAFSYYMTEVFEKDKLWDYADGIYDDGKTQDGVITFDEMNRYLRKRIGCARIKGEVPNDSGMMPDLLTRDTSTRNQPFAIKASKIKNYNTPFWDDVYISDTLHIHMSAMRMLKGGINLVNNPGYYQDLAAKNGQLKSIQENAEVFRQNFKSQVIPKNVLNSLLVLSEKELTAFNNKAAGSNRLIYLNSPIQNQQYQDQVWANANKQLITTNSNTTPTNSNSAVNANTATANANIQPAFPTVQKTASIREYYGAYRKYDGGGNRIYYYSSPKTFKSAVELFAQDEYDSALSVLKSIEPTEINKIKSDDKLSEEDKQLNFERFYLMMGLLFRYTGNLPEAIGAYDKGLQLVPESSKLMFEKASTLVLMPEKTKSRIQPSDQAVDLALNAIKRQLAVNNGAIPDETKKSVASFASQLFFLGRIGNLSEFNKKLNELVK